jgi:Helix-turn-helix domain
MRLGRRLSNTGRGLIIAGMIDTTDTQRVGTAYEKWGDALNAGFQLVPDVLLKHQSRLGLSPVDLAVLLNVLMHWWFAEQLPFPETFLIARRMGVGQRTVQRSLQRLEQLGLIERVKGARTSEATKFDPSCTA